MNQTTAKLLEKASRAIAAGESAVSEGHIEAATARAYYAMFHVAQSLLNDRGLRFRKHGGVYAAFGEHFAKSGLLDQRYHRRLLAAFNRRIIADYSVEAELSAEEVRDMIGQASEFLQAAREFLGASE